MEDPLRNTARPHLASDASLDAYAVADHLARLRREADSDSPPAPGGSRLLAPARQLYGRLRRSLT